MPRTDAQRLEAFRLVLICAGFQPENPLTRDSDIMSELVLVVSNQDDPNLAERLKQCACSVVIDDFGWDCCDSLPVIDDSTTFLDLYLKWFYGEVLC